MKLEALKEIHAKNRGFAYMEITSVNCPGQVLATSLTFQSAENELIFMKVFESNKKTYRFMAVKEKSDLIELAMFKYHAPKNFDEHGMSRDVLLKNSGHGYSKGQYSLYSDSWYVLDYDSLKMTDTGIERRYNALDPSDFHGWVTQEEYNSLLTEQK